VSFIRYLDDLYESGAVEQTHIVGDDQQLFETTASSRSFATTPRLNRRRQF